MKTSYVVLGAFGAYVVYGQMQEQKRKDEEAERLRIEAAKNKGGGFGDVNLGTAAAAMEGGAGLVNAIGDFFNSVTGANKSGGGANGDQRQGDETNTSNDNEFADFDAWFEG